MLDLFRIFFLFYLAFSLLSCDEEAEETEKESSASVEVEVVEVLDEDGNIKKIVTQKTSNESPNKDQHISKFSIKFDLLRPKKNTDLSKLVRQLTKEIDDGWDRFEDLIIKNDDNKYLDFLNSKTFNIEKVKKEHFISESLPSKGSTGSVILASDVYQIYFDSGDAISFPDKKFPIILSLDQEEIDAIDGELVLVRYLEAEKQSSWAAVSGWRKESTPESKTLFSAKVNFLRKGDYYAIAILDQKKSLACSDLVDKKICGFTTFDFESKLAGSKIVKAITGSCAVNATLEDKNLKTNAVCECPDGYVLDNNASCFKNAITSIEKQADDKYTIRGIKEADTDFIVLYRMVDGAEIYQTYYSFTDDNKSTWEWKDIDNTSIFKNKDGTGESSGKGVFQYKIKSVKLGDKNSNWTGNQQVFNSSWVELKVLDPEINFGAALFTCKAATTATSLCKVKFSNSSNADLKTLQNGITNNATEESFKLFPNDIIGVDRYWAIHRGTLLIFKKLKLILSNDLYSLQYLRVIFLIIYALHKNIIRIK